MKNFTFKSIFTVLALLLAVTSYSQGRTCGMMEYMEEMLKDPVLAKEYEANQRLFKAEVANRLNADFNARGGATIVIPVAVHFMTGNTADRACLEALAQNQIDILNADYTATNADLSIWNNQSGQYFPGLNPGSANISFCLATSNHPAAVPQLIEGQPAVTIGYNFSNGSGFPEMDANFQGYMNFIVKGIGGLGYSPLGGSVTQGMGVVLNTFAFGSGPGCPASGIVPNSTYGLGRTVTHELGHFYGLNHTFNADGGGSCGAGGDGIADTPEVANSTYGCPSNPTPFACNAPERRLTMNYMDYVDDACMYMFTPSQMNNVDSYVSAVLASQFKPGVCGPGNPGFTLTANDSPIYSCPNTDTEASFNLSYTTIANFNETTTFSASGLPANATVDFTPSTLNNDGDFVMTVGNLGATAVGVYTIEVTGTSNTVTESVDVELFNNCAVVTCDDYVATDLPVVISPVGGPTDYTSTITITEDLPIDDINVTFAIDHTWIRDITATITSPNGTVVELTSVNGVDGAGEYQNTVFDQEAGAGTDIAGATPPGNIFIGPYTPEGDLSLIYGEMSAGDWVLTITDNFDLDGGNLTNFEIELCLEDALSISEFELNGFAIFPNPNKGEFTIKLNSNSGSDIKVNVFDIRGRRIFNNAYTNNGDFNETVNLNNVQAGMYLVTVNDGNNEITKRIIVE
ncbi:T9SS type A sorting domain-containing protein [Psychroserpens jangbogonensis]|uniref:zinc-dependent metalloprotease n=1 Tax=Psychroserpens jangbogonensis TaxID=1484460 RepID=UPI00053DB82C|nr:T9SS type A sorting domain-containing protein [Psychroserpens jangbogonensis]